MFVNKKNEWEKRVKKKKRYSPTLQNVGRFCMKSHFLLDDCVFPKIFRTLVGPVFDTKPLPSTVELAFTNPEQENKKNTLSSLNVLFNIMSFLTRTTPLRFISKTNSVLFHTSRIHREEWSKASLRRMKKPELVRLAKENKLDNISGTKNELIIQLLNLQTAKIIGSPSFARQVVEKKDESPVKAVLAQEPSQKDATETEADITEGVDTDWINAFDMKVAHRGSRKPLSDVTSALSVSKPHRFNDTMKASVAKPVVTEQEMASAVEDQKVTQAPNTVTDPEEVDGMDPQWVEAFDLKVGSRGARSHSKFADTLTPSPEPTLTSQIEFITNNNKNEKILEEHHEEPAVVQEVAKKTVESDHTSTKQPTTEEDNQQSNQSTEQNNRQSNKPTVESVKQSIADDNTAVIDEHTSNNNSSSRDTWINASVGASMFLWYFGGEDSSLSKIWHFLSSSS